MLGPKAARARGTKDAEMRDCPATRAPTTVDVAVTPVVADPEAAGVAAAEMAKVNVVHQRLPVIHGAGGGRGASRFKRSYAPSVARAFLGDW